MLVLIALLLATAQNPGQKTAQVDTAERASDPQDKMICKRFVETGSLVRGTRVCKPKREWERDRDNIRATGPGVDSCANRGNGGGCN